jgi:hypothetical protein
MRIMNAKSHLLPGVALVAVFLLTALDLGAAVTINSPANGAAVSSPVQLTATLSGARSATILVYDNGSLVLQKYGVSSIAASLTLTGGSHTITVEEVAARRRNSSATITIVVSTPVVPMPTPSSPNIGTEIAADMTGTNEGFPHGVPLSYDWANGPVVVMGNNATGWQAMTAWGLVYVASQGNPATNTRVNIRDVQSYFLQKSTGKWLLLQNTNTPDGAAYLENFAGDTSMRGDVRNEPDGTISVTAGGGYNYHFYPSARATINPNDIGGIVTIFQARLIVDNPSLPDDRNAAAYLAASGGDYYPALTGSWPGNLSYNPGIASGKLKYVKTYWRFFSMTTMTAAQLQNNPPPIDLSGIQP